MTPRTVHCRTCSTVVEILDIRCPGCGQSVCRACGCSGEHGCPDGCYWVDPATRRLCSSCTSEAAEIGGAP